MPPVLGLTTALAVVAPATITVPITSALAALITTERRRAEMLLIDVFPFIEGREEDAIRSDSIRLCSICEYLEVTGK